PPAAAAARMHAGSATSAGVASGGAAPTTEHASTPAVSCPSPPMLNRPASSAIDTARPVNASAVALYSTWPSAYGSPTVREIIAHHTVPGALPASSIIALPNAIDTSSATAAA